MEQQIVRLMYISLEMMSDNINNINIITDLKLDAISDEDPITTKIKMKNYIDEDKIKKDKINSKRNEIIQIRDKIQSILKSKL